MCCWHVDRLLSEVFRCMHEAGLWRHSALPVSLQTLELVPSIFHKTGEAKPTREGGKCSPNKKLASHPFRWKILAMCRPSPLPITGSGDTNWSCLLEAGFLQQQWRHLYPCQGFYWRNLEATPQLSPSLFLNSVVQSKMEGVGKERERKEEGGMQTSP